MTFPPNTTAIDSDVNLTPIHSKLGELGFDTIFRYCAPGARSAWKTIKPPESRSQKVYGLKLILIYESTAEDILGGHTEGAKAGAYAASFAPTVGLLPGMGCAIYPTADFDLKISQLNTAMSYLRAFAEAAQGYDLGFYANGIANDEAHSEGIIKYRWITQSMGFAGTRESLEANRYEIVQRMPTEIAGIKDIDPNSLRTPGLEIGARVPWSVVPMPAKPTTDTPVATKDNSWKSTLINVAEELFGGKKPT